MALQAGSTLGSYEIVSLLGRGGMGEVWRARDTRLGRDVAIKILPPEVAAEPERRERFAREAQLLAALNHPNIAAIYGLEEAGETLCLVLELVEGRDPCRASRARPHAPRGDPAERTHALPRAGERTRSRHRAPRSQAGQRQAGPGRIGRRPRIDRPRQGTRLRPRQSDGGRFRGSGAVGDPVADTQPAGDAGRRHPRHRCLHESRAGARAARRQAGRHLGLRRSASRDAHRQAPLRRRNGRRHAGRGARPRARPVGGSRRHSASDSASARARTAAGSRRPAARHRRRPAGDRRGTARRGRSGAESGPGDSARPGVALGDGRALVGGRPARARPAAPNASCRRARSARSAPLRDSGSRSAERLPSRAAPVTRRQTPRRLQLRDDLDPRSRSPHPAPGTAVQQRNRAFVGSRRQRG